MSPLSIPGGWNCTNRVGTDRARTSAISRTARLDYRADRCSLWKAARFDAPLASTRSASREDASPAVNNCWPYALAIPNELFYKRRRARAIDRPALLQRENPRPAAIAAHDNTRRAFPFASRERGGLNATDRRAFLRFYKCPRGSRFREIRAVDRECRRSQVNRARNNTSEYFAKRCFIHVELLL